MPLSDGVVIPRRDDASPAAILLVRIATASSEGGGMRFSVLAEGLLHLPQAVPVGGGLLAKTADSLRAGHLSQSRQVGWAGRCEEPRPVCLRLIARFCAAFHLSQRICCFAGHQVTPSSAGQQSAGPSVRAWPSARARSPFAPVPRTRTTRTRGVM